MAKLDPQVMSHLEWLGFVRPTGLVVSAPALVRAGAILDRRDAEGQRRLRDLVGDGEDPCINDFRAFAERVLGWSFKPKGYAGTEDAPIPPELAVPLPDSGKTLRPDFAVRELETQDSASPWQLLVSVLKPGEDFDRALAARGHLELSPQCRMERLLRETSVSAGLLVNGKALRLISAPRGESSGWLDFHIADMVQTAGRPISTALRLLLSEQRLLALPRHQRLAALLAYSRKFQNEVSEKLAEQVLHALYELLRGFQAAHDASNGDLLREVMAEDPDRVYRALLSVILRLVFLLYAEEREMLPSDETYLQFYSLSGLYDRLREDAALYPDTMDQRYGAWAQCLALFRMVHDGAEAPNLRLPPRHGVLFDPDRYKFLEGRTDTDARQIYGRIEPPLVPDGTIYRALEKLLILDGERISYRALDVEQIGSVYETMMGFRLETATGRSVAIKAQKKHGAPTTVDLDALLAEPSAKRSKWVLDRAERKLTDTVKKTVAEAATLEDLHAALLPMVDQSATTDIVPSGAMVLQPSEERRRSGSHYTPRELTEPIVRTTIEPILARLREDALPPRPAKILDLKVCDPAMGSGAFLVEACRFLGDALVESWRIWGEAPAIPSDEDEVVFARRLIAQRCLYGVDRNPVAVDLAKMSLWLVTLAKDHPLTFLDHALRHGDSLVGLSRRQIKAFHWEADAPRFQAGFEAMKVHEHLGRVAELRRKIREAGEGVTDFELRNLWDEAQFELSKVRLLADLAVAAFFEVGKARERESKRSEFANAVVNGQADRYRVWLQERREVEPPLAPFHWEIEFPEAFERENPGFDVFVGNPPFAGKNSVSRGNVAGYLDWLKTLHEKSHGNADLVAHFFRRAFALLRDDGTFGLIATNTIAQGDTRASGLRWICQHGGEIFHVRKRVRWPGMAAVVVSIVNVMKGPFEGARSIDGREEDRITAFLFHRGGHDDPKRLAVNVGKSFQGSIVLGMGFTFDDADTKGVATPLAQMRLLIEKDAKNNDVIFPYIGYAEVASSPQHLPDRYVIDFGERNAEECRQCWPELMAIVEAKVRPERIAQKDPGAKEKWWQFIRPRPELHAAIAGLNRVLVTGSQASTHYAFAFLPTGLVYSSNLTVIATETNAAFATLQSRVHEIWARFFMSTMKDDLAYTHTTCFETFPFPDRWEIQPVLEAAGRAYYEYRAALMVKNDEGITKTYNRFNEPDERDSEIARLRELHSVMDRAVIEAYGWIDIPTECEFLLDYEIDEKEWGNRKKPYRYRWPEEVQTEVLTRLLDLNAERASAESRSGVTSAKRARSARRRSKIKPSQVETKDLFSGQEGRGV